MFAKNPTVQLGRLHSNPSERKDTEIGAHRGSVQDCNHGDLSLRALSCVPTPTAIFKQQGGDLLPRRQAIAVYAFFGEIRC
jgi:hypothetical protein